MLHNHASLRGALLVTSLLLTISAYALQCPAESLEAKYGKADRVFLVLVTDTKLEPGIEIGIRDRALQYATPISAGYRVVEDFKGDPDYRPRLLDLLGIGTGHVGSRPE